MVHMWSQAFGHLAIYTCWPHLQVHACIQYVHACTSVSSFSMGTPLCRAWSTSREESMGETQDACKGKERVDKEESKEEALL